jgi:hypothetical protein
VIDRSQFELIRERHGHYASWAIWAAASDKPKSNVGDLSVLDPDLNPELLQTLRTDVIMVGLNISRPLAEPFRNYMTDIIKNVEIVTSTKLCAHLKAFPALIQSNVETFLNELRDLNATKPTVLAFGGDAYQLIVDYVPLDTYGPLTRVTHYSHQISKEKYRDTILAQIAASETTTSDRGGELF